MVNLSQFVCDVWHHPRTVNVHFINGWMKELDLGDSRIREVLVTENGMDVVPKIVLIALTLVEVCLVGFFTQPSKPLDESIMK